MGNEEEITLLHSAVIEGDIELVKKLLMSKVDVNATDEEGKTALHHAVSKGKFEIVTELLLNGAEVDATDFEDKTPLHYAAEVGVMKELLAHGADVNAKDFAGETPLNSFVSQNMRTFPEERIRQPRDNADVTDGENKTLLRFEMLSYLLEHGADINAKDWCGGTALHDAMASGNDVQFIDVLLKYGADIHARNESDETPLHVAWGYTGGVERVIKLLKHGADANALDEYELTPLDCAISSMKGYHWIRQLIKYGANINIRHFEGEDCLNHSYVTFGDVMGPRFDKDERCREIVLKSVWLNNFDEKMQIFRSESNKNRIQSSGLSKYQDKCFAEIRKMKADKIEHVSVFELVTKHLKTIALRNKELFRRLSTIDCYIDITYPIYRDLISDRIELWVERSKLFEAIGKLQIYTKLDQQNQGIADRKILDPDSIYKIVKYLSNYDMSNLVQACDESNKNVNKSLKPKNDTAGPDAKRKRTRRKF